MRSDHEHSPKSNPPNRTNLTTNVLFLQISKLLIAECLDGRCIDDPLPIVQRLGNGILCNSCFPRRSVRRLAISKQYQKRDGVRWCWPQQNCKQTLTTPMHRSGERTSRFLTTRTDSSFSMYPTACAWKGSSVNGYTFAGLSEGLGLGSSMPSGRFLG